MSADTDETTPVDVVLAALDAHGLTYETAGDGWRAQCPGHEGEDHNLAIGAGDDGQALLYCHSHECQVEDILAPIGIRERDLFPAGRNGRAAHRRDTRARKKEKPTKKRPGLLDAHQEHLIDGYAERLAFMPKLLDVLIDERALSREVIGLYRVGAMAVWKNGTGRFVIPYLSWRPGEERRALGYVGHLPKSMRGSDERSIDALPGHARWPLACLDDQVFDGPQVVVITEAEMDALAVRSTGHPSYGAPGAASWNDAYAHELRGYGVRRAVVVGDRDDPGQKFNQKVVSSLAAVGIPCAAVELPEHLGEKGDITDLLWKTPGRDRHDLLAELIEDTIPDIATEGPAPDELLDGSLIDGAELLDRVVVALKRYVQFADDAQAWAVALWTACTHAFAHETFDTAPYLIITSAEKQSGKTRLIEVIAELVRDAWRISTAPTISSLFRVIDQRAPTVLFDEIDELFAANGDEIKQVRAALNAGYRRGATVPRVEGDHANREVKDFSVFAMKLLAGLRASQWPDTTRDRGIIIELRRRLAGERVERFRLKHAAPALHELREELAAWADANAETMAAFEANDIEQISDRKFEVWEPLLAVAHAAGGEWPKRAHTAALLLSGVAEPDTDSLGVVLLRDLKVIFATHAVDGRLSTSAAVKALNDMEESPWQNLRDGKGIDSYRVAKFLRGYGVTSDTMRFGEKSLRGWTRDDLADAWRRYLPSPSSEGSTSSTSSTPDGSSTEIPA